VKRAEKLLHRIHRRYQTVRRTIQVAGIEIDFVRIADPDVVLDQVAAEEDRLEKIAGQRTAADQLHLPYWAELWESAHALAELLPGYRQRIDTNFSVLDLGCGMGLAGAVAARLGMRVLFADFEAPALLFARLNSLSDATRVRTRRLDWRSDRLNEKFDLILGADILYERKQWDHLNPFWQAHLKPTGTILLGEPGRQTGDEFEPWIATRGWAVNIQHAQPPTRTTPIRVFVLSQPAPPTAPPPPA
jgi:predicted nicotinamide N-methyase